MEDRVTAKIDTSAPECFRSLSRSPGRDSQKKKLFSPFNRAEHLKRLRKRVIVRREEEALREEKVISLSPKRANVKAKSVFRKSY